MTNKRKRGISPHLSFEEFDALANRQPNLKGSWIYKVTQAFFDGTMKNPYPKFELDCIREFFFKSFKAAEMFVNQPREDIYCSWITQLPCGGSDAYRGMGAEWLYDQHGKLLDYTVTTDCCGKSLDQIFFGRPESRQRFKTGDIVEVVSGSSVRLAVVNKPVVNVEWCWEYYKSCEKENDLPYFLDYSDDMAIVIDGPDYAYHYHVGPQYLLNPRFPIPEDILTDIQTWNDRCDNGGECSEYESHGVEWHKEKGQRMGEFYQMSIYLHFDSNGQNPHLHINDGYGLKVGLRIDCPEYYDHEDYDGRLTDTQINSLYHYLSSTDLGKTEWWYMLREWNEDSEEGQILPLGLQLPDYRKLNTINLG